MANVTAEVLDSNATIQPSGNPSDGADDEGAHQRSADGDGGQRAASCSGRPR